MQELADTRRGANLRNLRKAKGWSRDALARKSETSEATIARTELYGHSPNLKVWDAWALALEVPVADLIDSGPADAA